MVPLSTQLTRADGLVISYARIKPLHRTEFPSTVLNQEEIMNSRISKLALAIAIFLLIALVPNASKAQEIVPDANTVLLDHFNGTTPGSVYGPLTYETSLPGLDRAARFGPGTFTKYAFPAWHPGCCGSNPSIQGTIELWVKPDHWGDLLNFNWNNTSTTPSAGHVLYAFGPLYSGKFGYHTWNGERGSLPASLTGTSVVPTGEWIHLAISWSPSISKVYVNGVMEVSVAANVYPAISPTVYAYLNGWGTGTFAGLIDEFHISKVQRTDEEIRLHANQSPVAVCQNVTVSAGPDCMANASIDNGSNDPGGDSITLTQTPEGPYPLGDTTVMLTVTNSHGASSSCQATVTVVDTTAPALTCPENVVVTLPPNSTATSMAVSFPAPTATDNCSAPNIVATPASGSVFPVGTTTVNVTATDGAGTQGTCSFTVTVLYDFIGFFQPVDNLPTINVAKAGSAIPMKWGLGGYKGMYIFAAGYPASGMIPCDSMPNADVIEETVMAGGSSLNYDAASGQYIYVWKTDKAWVNTCRQLVVKLNDGMYHRANFRFK